MSAAVTGITVQVATPAPYAGNPDAIRVDNYTYTCTTPERAASIVTDTIALLAPGQRVVGIIPHVPDTVRL